MDNCNNWFNYEKLTFDQKQQMQEAIDVYVNLFNQENPNCLKNGGGKNGGGKNGKGKKSKIKKQWGGDREAFVNGFKNLTNFMLFVFIVYILIQGPTQEAYNELKKGFQMYQSGQCNTLATQTWTYFRLPGSNIVCTLTNEAKNSIWGLMTGNAIVTGFIYEMGVKFAQLYTARGIRNEGIQRMATLIYGDINTNPVIVGGVNTLAAQIAEQLLTQMETRNQQQRSNQMEYRTTRQRSTGEPLQLTNSRLGFGTEGVDFSGGRGRRRKSHKRRKSQKRAITRKRK